MYVKMPQGGSRMNVTSFVQLGELDREITMDDERRAWIEIRCAAATPGPWTAHPYAEDFEIQPVACGQDYGVCSRADAEFIAHAREDIPALLAEIDKLWGAIARLRDESPQDILREEPR
jgi:hypothetical protein